jgi:hypothetical protein
LEASWLAKALVMQMDLGSVPRLYTSFCPAFIPFWLVRMHQITLWASVSREQPLGHCSLKRVALQLGPLLYRRLYVQIIELNLADDTRQLPSSLLAPVKANDPNAISSHYSPVCRTIPTKNDVHATPAVPWGIGLSNAQTRCA